MDGESSTPIIYNRCDVQLVIYGNASRDIASRGSGFRQRGSSTGQVEELHVVLCIGATARSIQTRQRHDGVSQHGIQRDRAGRRGRGKGNGRQRGWSIRTAVIRDDRDVCVSRRGEKARRWNR